MSAPAQPDSLMSPDQPPLVILPTGHHSVEVVELRQAANGRSHLHARLGDEHVTVPLSGAVPEPAPVAGERVTVFVYRDADHNRVATFLQPASALNSCTTLRVVGTSTAGSFLDWGLDQHVLLPRSQQRDTSPVGAKTLVWIYVDERSGRVTASERVDRFLQLYDRLAPGITPLRRGQQVDLVVLGKSPLGVKLVVNQCYNGLVFNDDAHRPLKRGQQLLGWIRQIRGDGKFDITLQQPDVDQHAALESRILEALAAADGRSTITDSSDPAIIRAAYQVSKKAYKRALGSLLSAGRISIGNSAIELVAGGEHSAQHSTDNGGKPRRQRARHAPRKTTQGVKNTNAAKAERQQPDPAADPTTRPRATGDTHTEGQSQGQSRKNGRAAKAPRNNAFSWPSHTRQTDTGAEGEQRNNHDKRRGKGSQGSAGSKPVHEAGAATGRDGEPWRSNGNRKHAGRNVDANATQRSARKHSH